MTAFHTVAIPHDEILQDRLTMDGFLAGRERVQEEVEKAAEQGGYLNEPCENG
jgi:hypothetical protein